MEMGSSRRMKHRRRHREKDFIVVSSYCVWAVCSSDYWLGTATRQPNSKSGSVLCPARASRGSVEGKVCITSEGNCGVRFAALGPTPVLRTGLIPLHFHLFRSLDNVKGKEFFNRDAIKTGLTNLSAHVSHLNFKGRRQYVIKAI